MVVSMKIPVRRAATDACPTLVMALRGVVHGVLPVTVLAAAVLGWAPVPAGAQAPIPLTLEEALELAVRNNPGFLATRNDEAAADWRVREGYAGFLPEANVTEARGTRTGSARTRTCSFPSSPPSPKAPGSGWRSAARSPRHMAGNSPWRTGGMGRGETRRVMVGLGLGRWPG